MNLIEKKGLSSKEVLELMELLKKANKAQLDLIELHCYRLGAENGA
tara:strand:- start:1894 stop:2031 length:138 start_codon:yes stop_codon:yes gene_type:complete